MFSTTVFAQSNVRYRDIILNISNAAGDYVNTSGDALPLSVSTSKYKQKDLTFAQLIFKNVNDIPDDSVIDLKIVFNDGNAFRVTEFKYCDVSFGGHDYKPQYSYDVDTATLTASFEIDKGATADEICAISLGISKSINPDYNAWFRVTDMTISYSSAEQSFRQKLNAMFSDLFGWLKDIRDNISNFGTDVGKWFSNLSSNISS